MAGGRLSALTLAAALGSGQVAGVFFDFSALVMTAVARLPAAPGIAAMQAINVAGINPAFAGVLFGTGVLSVVLAAASFTLALP